MERAGRAAGDQVVRPGIPGRRDHSAAALLSYDVPHRAPWDWRVSLYTWTKGIAAGAYLVPLAAAALAACCPTGQLALALWRAPVVAGVFLALTGGLLIWDLEHPARFYMIFTRPQWRSWLVRGACHHRRLRRSCSLLHFVAVWRSGSTAPQQCAR